MVGDRQGVGDRSGMGDRQGLKRQAGVVDIDRGWEPGVCGGSQSGVEGDRQVWWETGVVGDRQV